MEKSPDAFRTISEVAAWLGLQPHVLRYWETKFPQIKPTKGAGGRRYYRPDDMRLVGGIKQLLHGQGLTIKAAQDLLKDKGRAHVIDLSPPLPFEGADDPDMDKNVLPFTFDPLPSRPIQKAQRHVQPLLFPEIEANLPAKGAAFVPNFTDMTPKPKSPAPQAGPIRDLFEDPVAAEDTNVIALPPADSPPKIDDMKRQEMVPIAVIAQMRFEDRCPDTQQRRDILARIEAALVSGATA